MISLWFSTGLKRSFNKFNRKMKTQWKLLSRIKKVQEDLLTLKEQCHELLKAKQDLIDKARTTLVGNRTLLQQMQASVGIPLISDSDDPAFANFNQIVDEWEAQVRSRTGNWMQTKKRTTLVLPGVTFLHIKEYGHSNHCLLWPLAARLWCHLVEA
uniref:Protein FAM33A n=1 Tax=Fagus sylvatica TaxID=28930 RepID=A0A2N9ICB6_FAGSY